MGLRERGRERAPALGAVLAFTAGDLLGSHLTTNVSTPLVAISVAVSAVTLGLARDLCRRGWVACAAAMLTVAFVALGVTARWTQRASRSGGDGQALSDVYRQHGADEFLTPKGLTGRLRREPMPGPFGWGLIIDAEWLEVGSQSRRVNGGVRLRVRGEAALHWDGWLSSRLRALNAGDRVFVWARLSAPTFFQNPGPTGSGARAHFERDEIHLLGSVKSALLLQRVEEAPWFVSLTSRARKAAWSRLSARLNEEPEVLGVVLALVSGERALMSDDIEERSRRAGFYHVMAISGAHVGVVLVALLAVCRLLGIETRTSLLAMLVVLPVYAAFCGARAPVVRAVSMTAIFIGARLLGLSRSYWNALALALLWLLSRDPLSASDPGLQMSFAAMAAIFGLALPGRDDPARARAGRSKLALLFGALRVSLSATLGVLPVAAWHFHRVQILSPLTSLLAVPLASLTLVLGLLCVLSSPLPWLSALFAWLCVPTVTALNSLARFASELPYASIGVARPSPIWISAYVAALGAWRLSNGHSRVRVVSALLFVGCLAAPFVSLPPASQELRMTALDVGHGDALVLSLPDGSVVVVDGGGLPGSSFDVGANIVVPYLLDNRLRSIDVVIASHRDYDHVAGLKAVVETLDVGAIWQASSNTKRAAYEELRNAATRRGVPVRTLATSETFRFGGVLFEVLAAGGDGNPGSENDRSLVLRVTHGRSRVLLTGDAERALETMLVREAGASVEAEVLKVAHHGSASSSSAEFLDAVRPEVAILSTREVPFRPIPSDEVLDRLYERGARVLRTDRDGAIEVVMHADGRIETTTFVDSAKDD